MKYRTLFFILSSILIAPLSSAHDTWLQTNTNVIRVNGSVHIDFFLGNHGNDHRDFKVAGKPDLEGSTLTLYTPDNKTIDLKPSLIDQGYTPKEGYYTARFEPVVPGLYLIAQASDKVVSYAPTRSIHSAKTFFLASKTLDKCAVDTSAFNKVLNHPLELVPQSHPVSPMGPGTSVKVQLLFKGKPLANTKVSFIPRGAQLSEGMDARYERNTDANGLASLELKEPTYYLIVAHYQDPNASGPNYTSTKYSATLTILVPAICPCCGE
jgi:uncharacterized GH25 family protein